MKELFLFISHQNFKKKFILKIDIKIYFDKLCVYVSPSNLWII